MTDTTPAAAVQIPAAGTYQLDPAASTVTFATRHIFGLAPVKGTFRLISGQITIADPVTSSTASAVIDAASFATGNPQRDKDVKSARLLHVRDHPQITFQSTELVRDGDTWRLLRLMRNPTRSRPQARMPAGRLTSSRHVRPRRFVPVF
jgi:polyisoprenoid-binding protein YceI